MVFEVQLTPQLFEFCAKLRMVDWDTIVLFTCPNVGKCMPDFAKGHFYMEEFGYI